MSLRILTGGESHGPQLTGVIEGLPAGLKLDKPAIDHQLHRRQQGHGRGGRMRIERDTVAVTAGLRFGVTLGSPLVLTLENRDHAHWTDRMNAWSGNDDAPMTIPRPGHADLAGAIKYGHHDLRHVLERASARETAMRVAVGAVCRQLLAEFKIEVLSQVTAIGGVESAQTYLNLLDQSSPEPALRQGAQIAERSPVRCADEAAATCMMAAIDEAGRKGDTLGGVIEVAALGVPAGLGSHVHWDRRLDADLAGLFISIPGIKGVENGLGFEAAQRHGSEVHDAILSLDAGHPKRESHRAGGLEGGLSNGGPLLFRCAMKPIPTLTRPLRSVDTTTGRPADAHRERSDVCAVPAAAVVAEAMMAIGLARALCDRLGHDRLDLMKKMWKLIMTC